MQNKNYNKNMIHDRTSLEESDLEQNLRHIESLEGLRNGNKQKKQGAHNSANNYMIKSHGP